MRAKNSRSLICTNRTRTTQVIRESAQASETKGCQHTTQVTTKLHKVAGNRAARRCKHHRVGRQAPPASCSCSCTRCVGSPRTHLGGAAGLRGEVIVLLLHLAASGAGGAHGVKVAVVVYLQICIRVHKQDRSIGQLRMATRLDTRHAWGCLSV
jgi:hypothetical protein